MTREDADMSAHPRRRFPASIRAFVATWMAIIVLSVLILAVVLFNTGQGIRLVTERVILLSRVVESTHRLELALLSERREDLLWRATGSEDHDLERNTQLAQADRAVRDLDVAATGEAEEILIDRLEERYREFRQAARSDPPTDLDRMTVMTDSLLELVDRHRSARKVQMTQTLEDSHRLTRQAQHWSLSLVLCVAAVVTAGSWLLMRRIVRPIVELSSAATRFGRGDFQSRATVLKNDEIGTLSRTFNHMAEDISRREREQVEFIASVVHDVKNPLLFVGGAARALLKDDLDRDQRGLWLNRILREVERLEDLVSDLVDTVQVETGRLVLELEDLDLSALVRCIQQEHDQAIATHTITFEGDERCVVLGDERRLERVVANLISNAVKYSPNGTRVRLIVERGPSGVALRVSDEGVGIAPQDLQVLFQPFGRLGRTRNMAKGIGLGLFTVKKIIEAHGASMRVTSELHVGTTVEIAFPST